jgi:hypothetical protein
VEQKSFTPSKGLSTSEAEALLMQWGRNELREKSKAKVTIRSIQTHTQTHVNMKYGIR